MTGLAHPTRTAPAGVRDGVRQVAIWAGFAASYEIVRGLAVGNRAVALANAHSIIRLEQRLGVFVEPSIQRHFLQFRLLVDLADWTYWLAQFAVVALVVVWVYVRRRHAYPWLRNTLIATNTIGLAGYLFFPVAPPRLVAGYGFRDTIASLHQRSGLVHLLANPYAAFPSLHDADALVIGVVVVQVTALSAVRIATLIWPVWVSFCLVLSANHFVLDVAVGVGAAIIGGLLATLVQGAARRSGHWSSRCGSSPHPGSGVSRMRPGEGSSTMPEETRR
jgi:membrane-associated phospholipid phosphatase